VPLLCNTGVAPSAGMQAPGVCCRRLVAIKGAEGDVAHSAPPGPHQGMPHPMHVRQHHSSEAP
jgi:hypothetical protein